MKKLYLALSATVMSIVMSLASCGTGSMSALSDELAFDSIQWEDSIVFGEENGSYCKLSVVYAANGPQYLVDSINTWVCEMLDDSTFAHKNDLGNYVPVMGKAQLNADNAEVTKAVKEEGLSYYQYNNDISVTVEYEDSAYITMCCDFYRYLGGAHGSCIMNFVTFDKKDGHRVGWEFLKDMDRKQLADAIKNGLLSYFEVKTMDELLDLLIIEDIFEEDARREKFYNDFPLPRNAPYLTKDGVAVIYQQYEIAPYAAGMPTCIVRK